MTPQPGFVRPCRNKPQVFHGFPRERPEKRDRRIAEAIDICLDCPLMIACRDQGRTLRERGIWGGETDAERRAAGYPPKPGNRTGSPIIRRTRAQILASQ